LVGQPPVPHCRGTRDPQGATNGVKNIPPRRRVISQKSERYLYLNSSHLLSQNDVSFQKPGSSMRSFVNCSVTRLFMKQNFCPMFQTRFIFREWSLNYHKFKLLTTFHLIPHLIILRNLWRVGSVFCRRYIFIVVSPSVFNELENSAVSSSRCW
jgi:hypothetical protein